MTRKRRRIVPLLAAAALAAAGCGDNSTESPSGNGDGDGGGAANDGDTVFASCPDPAGVAEVTGLDFDLDDVTETGEPGTVIELFCVYGSFGDNAAIQAASGMRGPEDFEEYVAADGDEQLEKIDISGAEHGWLGTSQSGNRVHYTAYALVGKRLVEAYADHDTEQGYQGDRDAAIALLELALAAR